MKENAYLEALTRSSEKFAEAKADAKKNRKKVRDGTLKTIISEAEKAFGLPAGSLKEDTVKKRVARNNLTGLAPQSVSPLASVEPYIVDWCVRLANMGAALTKDQVISLADSLIERTSTRNDLITFKQKRGIEVCEEGVVVGTGWYRGFMRRNSETIRTRQGRVKDMKRHSWCVYEHFELMYDSIYKKYMNSFILEETRSKGRLERMTKEKEENDTLLANLKNLQNITRLTSGTLYSRKKPHLDGDVLRQVKGQIEVKDQLELKRQKNKQVKEDALLEKYMKSRRKYNENNKNAIVLNSNELYSMLRYHSRPDDSPIRRSVHERRDQFARREGRIRDHELPKVNNGINNEMVAAASLPPYPQDDDDDHDGVSFEEAPYDEDVRKDYLEAMFFLSGGTCTSPQAESPKASSRCPISHPTDGNNPTLDDNLIEEEIFEL
jgi:hypothetical protein